MYRQITDGAGAVLSLQRMEDGASIPLDEANLDYRAFLAWQAEGHVAEVAAPAPPSLAAYANARQWALATGGYTITVAGSALTFATDTTSQALMDGKATRLGQPGPPPTIKWQFPGGFVTLSAAHFLAAAIQVADFVQSTFDALDAVFAAIEAGTIASHDDVDAFAWPSNVSASPI